MALIGQEAILPIAECVESLVLGDSPEAISTAVGLTATKFSSLWARWAPQLDLVLCLGDRYEMFAAVAAALPFGMRIGHFHGGETTLGAIDNAYRHSLTLMAQLHFVSTEGHATRVRQVLGEAVATAQVHNVGALSLSNLRSLKLLSVEQFQQRFGIDLSQPTALVTFHPETVAFSQTAHHVAELVAALEELPEQVLITMPNADTLGSVVRAALAAFVERHPERAVAVESLGTLGYFSAMRHCAYLLGNTSSGLIEAASLGRYVLNLGDRQAGREAGPNVVPVPLERAAIVAAAAQIRHRPPYAGPNPYGDGSAADRVTAVLTSLADAPVAAC